MKIAIYGDSFVCHQQHMKDPTGKDSQPHLGRGWTEILEDFHEIKNFGSSGTAFMYSYEIFLKEHKNYDLNIFAITSPLRTYIRALDGMTMFGVGWVDHEYERIKKLPFYNRKDIHLDILKSVRVYIELWQDYEICCHTQHAVVNNIWNLAPNTLVIPGFPDSIEQTTGNLQDLSRYELSLVDNNKYDNFDFNYMFCKRRCHFSEENNKVIANLILSAIESGDKIFTARKEELVAPLNKDFSFFVEEKRL